ncbi:UPF0481 protein At3g47200-like [Diospyros lotus]|uniref:UPF0481 protein At3g47200-like n=1 Tax=Diospyros lotus TaxID=55363 RepID=UPI0022507C07|nr:UPF0481 protein At3g47200-like [Diospyros lotus]XP_052208574.1 UPF0481 protein At3g47200-like [Diospyros lotus]
MSSRRERDPVSVRIDHKLARLSDSSSSDSLFRVHNRLHKVNPYEPAIVAIGPYHRQQDELQEMEKQKLRYLKQLLRRTRDTVDEYVTEIRGLEAKAREFYHLETSGFNRDELVEMMVLDGCFIVELFRKYKMNGLSRENDTIFQSEQLRFALRRDLILLENQLPFFVLHRLFGKTRVPGEEGDLIPLALAFLKKIMPNEELTIVNNIQPDNLKHLLALVHASWGDQFSPARKVSGETWDFVNSATELNEAGVEFKREETGNLFNIRFINGVLQIPRLCIGDYTEFPLRNLLAYEQYHLQGHQRKYVSDYIAFMNCLVNSPRDVQLLRHSKIIDSWVADDAAVYALLKDVYRFVLIAPKDFSYSQVCVKLNGHCRRRQNVWMANLMRNYFNSPWAFVSFIAACVLLLLTFIQTLFSVLSYTK